MSTVSVSNRAEPLRLPLADAAMCRRMNVIVGTHRVLNLRLAGETATLTFSALPPGWTRAAAFGCLRFRCGEHLLELGLPGLPAPGTFGLAFAGIELDALPEELLLGALEVWLEEPLAILNTHGVSLELERWRLGAPDASPACLWELRRADHVVSGSLCADAATLEFLSDLLVRSPATPSAGADDLPIAVALEIARLSLPLARLRNLVAGDVILLPRHLEDLARVTGEFRVGGRACGEALRQGRRLTLLTMTPNTAPSESESVSTNDVAAVLPVDDLPVQLVFEAGRTEVSVGKLRTLAEGHTFELPERSDALVSIRANGREVGRGELVDLGGRTGVRIVDWTLA